MEENESTNPNLFEETATPTPAPKRRGRPPKNPGAVKPVHEENAAPKRRGRPPKHVEASSETLELVAPPAQDTAASPATSATVFSEGEKKPFPRTGTPAFAFDPTEDAIGRRERETQNNPENSQTGTAIKLNPEEIIARNKPQLSPERAPEKMAENVYTPDDNSNANQEEKSDENENFPRAENNFDNAKPADGNATEANPENTNRGEWRERYPNRNEKWERRNPQRFNPQDRSGSKGFSRFQPRDRNLPTQNPQAQQTRENNFGGNAPQPQARFPKREKFQAGKFNAQGKFDKFKERDAAQKPAWGALANTDSAEEATLDIGNSFDYNKLKEDAFLSNLKEIAKHTSRVEKTVPVTEAEPNSPAPKPVETLVPCTPAETLDFNEIYDLPMAELIERAKSFGIPVFRNPQRRSLIRKILNAAFEQNRPIALAGTLELLANGHGLLLYTSDNFRVRELSAFVPSVYVKKFGLQRGHELTTIVHPPMPGETAPIVVEITSIMGTDPEEIKNLTPFTELTPYYPTERIMLETTPEATNNLSMRCVDLLCPIGLGQRGLIVAPPRVGKTVLLQTMANSILKNKPNAKLIVLLVDERPEEVTDFRRNTKGAEVISSTFDETAENHVHVAEMVIERSRRMVELGMDVIILLDSITRLARAYNTLMPNGGKILSGGVEAGALAKPKRFFGSARNIEDGGSLTILGTALIDTGSKMDEVIFEEFKGTGNMELDLDRDLANKRIFPAINFERSGTRKEELLYHPDEMQYVYSMRRAMKGVPSIEAMEMLINRMKKTKTNIEFLMTLASR